MDLLIASRQSDLARLQAYQVGDCLASLGHNIKYHFRESLGDINQDDPLWKMPEKGVFTEDFREGLEKGEWDMVVHSWKDLPIDPLPKTELVATLPRADARDVLLFKKNHLAKVKSEGHLKIYSSSPRRIYNLTPFFKNSFPCEIKEVNFSSVRGNILTRVSKLMQEGEVDGLIVAKAALDRLLSVHREEFVEGQEALKTYLADCLVQVLPLSENPTAAAQGALAIEIRKDRGDLKKVLQEIHCSKTWNNASAEREILKGHGGGCHQKIGVTRFSLENGEVTVLRGETEQGEVLQKLSYSQPLPVLQNPCLKEFKLFEREKLPISSPLPGDAHFLAKAEALPSDYKLPEGDVIWTSGVSSWFKLARRGYWVSGCSDSIGEEGLEEMGPLFQNRKWCKWTHDEAPPSNDKSVIHSYQLKALDPVEDFSQYQEFFWMSGSQFERAVQLYPKILQAQHFCGPGHTYKKIQQVLKAKRIENSLTALPNREFWLKAAKGQ